MRQLKWINDWISEYQLKYLLMDILKWGRKRGDFRGDSNQADFRRKSLENIHGWLRILRMARAPTPLLSRFYAYFEFGGQILQESQITPSGFLSSEPHLLRQQIFPAQFSEVDSVFLIALCSSFDRLHKVLWDKPKRCLSYGGARVLWGKENEKSGPTRTQFEWFELLWVIRWDSKILRSCGRFFLVEKVGATRANFLATASAAANLGFI